MEEQQYEQNDIESTKGLACLSYLGILFLIPMLVNKNSPYTKFHVNQGIVLLIAEIILGVASGLIRFALGLIPFIGGIIANLLGIVIGLVCLAFIILGIVNAAQGRAQELPVIGSIRIYR